MECGPESEWIQTLDHGQRDEAVVRGGRPDAAGGAAAHHQKRLDQIHCEADDYALVSPEHWCIWCVAFCLSVVCLFVCLLGVRDFGQ